MNGLNEICNFLDGNLMETLKAEKEYVQRILNNETRDYEKNLLIIAKHHAKQAFDTSFDTESDGFKYKCLVYAARAFNDYKLVKSLIDNE